MAQCHVKGGGGALEQIGEQTGVDVGLFVQEVEFSTICLLCGQVVCQDFGLEALGQVVFEFEFCVEAVGCGPGLSQGQAYLSEEEALVVRLIDNREWERKQRTSGLVAVFSLNLSLAVNM